MCHCCFQGYGEYEMERIVARKSKWTNVFNSRWEKIIVKLMKHQFEGLDVLSLDKENKRAGLI